MKPEEKLRALRTELERQGLGGWIVPRADEHQGEFVAPCAERLKWLTGFTGSAGVAIILKDKAAVLSDGRYTIQMKQELDPALYQTGDSVALGIGGWLALAAPKGVEIGFDPTLHTPAQIKKIEDSLQGCAITLKPVLTNLVDAIWPDQPAKPQGEVFLFPDEIAGQSAEAKIATIKKDIAASGVCAAILTLPDSIAWLLNIRGQDVKCLPIALSHAIVYATDRPVQWIIDPRKIVPQVRNHLGEAVQIIPPEKLEELMIDLAHESISLNAPVMIDYAHAPIWFVMKLQKEKAQILEIKDPCILPKSRKSQSEVEAIRQAHIHDGAALAKFLCWLDQLDNIQAQTEITIEKKLLEFRRQNTTFKDDSFATIAACGANGAIVHYRAKPQTAARLERDQLLLLDSGAQYHWGTTDITRTIILGTPTKEMRDHFTRVLKGHIALATAKFPEGTLGSEIDVLARKALGEIGLDYAHGTGHGVGCYLSVHEEAASISPRGKEPLQAGMLLSNEPGYYKEGEYGIRIENLVLVKKQKEGQEDMLGFETISLAPIDRRLIEVERLDPAELEWLNAYHAHVEKSISPLVEPTTQEWLAKATAPLGI